MECSNGKKHWRSITFEYTKKELRDIARTLGKYGIDWMWMPKYGGKFTVAIPKEEFDRINKKWKKVGERRS